MACTEPSMKRIDNLVDRVEKTEKNIKKLESDFDFLINEYKAKESSLRNNELVAEVQLLRAYLQQFEDERVVMKNDKDFTLNQLNNLKEDFEKGLYDDETREKYLDSEEAAVKKMEAKIKYFSDRFQSQRDFLKSVDNH